MAGSDLAFLVMELQGQRPGGPDQPLAGGLQQNESSPPFSPFCAYRAHGAPRLAGGERPGKPAASSAWALAYASSKPAAPALIPCCGDCSQRAQKPPGPQSGPLYWPSTWQ